MILSDWNTFAYRLHFSHNFYEIHDVHKYLPWQSKKCSKWFSFLLFCEFINIFILLCELNFGPAWLRRVDKLHTHFMRHWVGKKNDKINWIRAHILIFIIVPVQTYLFHLPQKRAMSTQKKKTEESIAWVRFFPPQKNT